MDDQGKRGWRSFLSGDLGASSWLSLNTQREVTEFTRGASYFPASLSWASTLLSAMCYHPGEHQVTLPRHPRCLSISWWRSEGKSRGDSFRFVGASLQVSVPSDPTSCTASLPSVPGPSNLEAFSLQPSCNLGVLRQEVLPEFVLYIFKNKISFYQCTWLDPSAEVVKKQADLKSSRPVWLPSETLSQNTNKWPHTHTHKIRF